MRRYLNTREAADLLGLSHRTLDRYRGTGAGPAFHKFGNSVRYRRSDLGKWAKERRRSSTSDDGSRARRPRGAQGDFPHASRRTPNGARRAAP